MAGAVFAHAIHHRLSYNDGPFVLLLPTQLIQPDEVTARGNGFWERSGDESVVFLLMKLEFPLFSATRQRRVRVASGGVHDRPVSL